MRDALHIPQLAALVWLKWRLFRNSVRSRRGAATQAASILGTLVALGFALVVAFGLGAFAYLLVAHGGGRVTMRPRDTDIFTAGATLGLFGMMSVFYLMWVSVPLSLSGGSQFDPGRLLLYPVSLRKLFLVDLLSELTSLASIFALPAALAVALGAGLGSGRVAAALAVGACAAACGLALTKLLATVVGVLMKTRRTRGESVLAVVGLLGAFSGVLIGQGGRLLAGVKEFPPGLRWTPPGAVAVALTDGLRGDAGAYLLALATLSAYALLALLLTYRVAVRALEGRGGARRGAEAAARARPKAPAPTGWQLPFLSPELSTIVEKELRYAARNPQLRVMAVMPLVLALSFKLIGQGRGGFMDGAAAPFLEGARSAAGVFYVFMIASSFLCNLFAYEGAGMRTLVLAPVSRRTVLVGKNIAACLITLALTAAVVFVNQLLHGDVSPRALLFTALVYAFFAGAFTLVGNWFSLRFPKRLEFGKRMNASGAAGLLLLPVFVALALPPAAAVLAGYLTGSLIIQYAILASFASAGVVAYLLLIGPQGRELSRRELDILETVTGRGDE